MSREYSRFGISDKEMAAWKKEYKAIRPNAKAVLEGVLRNPIDVSSMGGCPSFDIDEQISLCKVRV